MFGTPDEVLALVFDTAFSTKVVLQKAYKSVKAYATMPIGIMGRKSFGVDRLRFKVFTNKKREDINTFVCAVSLYVAETP